MPIDVLNKRKAAGDCGRYGGSDHKHYHCPKYCPAHFPDDLKVDKGADSAGGDDSGHQLKLSQCKPRVHCISLGGIK